jgi:phosphate:Na+ symporter
VAFILLGVNIGTSLTTVIASIPASRESKRAAFFHIMYDIIGSVIFGSLILFFPGILDWFTRTWQGNYAQQAAMFHTIYNVSTMLLLLPFVGKIAQLMQKIVPVIAEKSSPDHEKKLVFLDTQISQAPSVSVLNAHMEVCRMGQIANENFNMAIDSFFEKDDKKVKKIKENEKVIDFLNHKITAKLAEMNRMTLSPQDAINVSKMFIILSDIERIGDHAINIAEHTNVIVTEGRNFSKTAVSELKSLTEATSLLITRSLDIFNKKDKESLAAVKAAEKKIDKNTIKYTKNHIERLKNGECEPSSGVMFTAVINDLERCADHAKNIAFSVSLEKKWDR